MGKKGKKRHLSEAESTDDLKVAKKNSQIDQNAPKKKKLKSNLTDLTAPKKQETQSNGDIQISKENDQVDKKLSKKQKKKAAKLNNLNAEKKVETESNGDLQISKPNVQEDKKLSKERTKKEKKKAAKLNAEKKVETEFNGDVQIPKENDQVNKLSKKKKHKAKLNDLNAEKETDTTVPKGESNADDSAKELKKKKKKKSKKQKDVEGYEKTDSTAETPKTEGTRTKSSEIKKVISTKRKAKFQEKRKKNIENRKLVRQQEGQHASINKLTLEEMKAKIAEIKGRETISKSALKKLRSLKKKVQVEEGTIDTSPVKNDNKDEQTKKQKNRKNKAMSAQNAEDNSPVKKLDNKINNKMAQQKKKSKADVSKKQLFIEDRVGNKFAYADSDDNQEAEIEKSKKIFQMIKKGKYAEKPEAMSDEEDIDSEVLEEDDEELNGKVDEEDSIDSEDESEDEDSRSKPEIKKPKKALETKKADVKANSDEENEEDGTTEKMEIDEGSESKKDKPVQKPKEKQKHNVNKTENVAGKKIRYVLFVGNIAYETTTVDLKKHFLTKVSKVKDVRIPSKPDTKVPRGFAYIEVENSIDYEKALSLHGTFVNGRQIKVEYTSPGSKTVSNRSEIIHKNKKLHAMRKAGMLAGSKKQGPKRSFQRYYDKGPKGRP